mgnify:CR=1 FL=1
MPFQIALSGLNVANSDLDITANNIANVNTTGFKRSRGNFAELFATGLQQVTSNAVGLGTRLAQVQTQFSQGSINFTQNNLDLAITGDGFFTLSSNEGLSYTRAGAFGVDRDGFVVNAQGARLQAFPPGAGDSFDTGQLADLRLTTTDNPPQATANIEAGLNLPADAAAPPTAPFDPTDPDTFNQTTSLTVFDSLGQEHSASYFFVKGANPNEWEVSLTIDGNVVGGPQPLEFDSSGALITPAPPGEITFPPQPLANGAEDLELTTDLSNLTQFGNAFGVNTLSQDGFASGRLSSVDINDDGIVFARFTNGQSTPLGKLALANFSNPQGLENLGDTAFAETFASGNALLGEAGTSSFGSIESGALEDANVDLSAELVNMITAQRNFQANAQMIRTADTVTQTVINLR